jgi:hypothetical protein
VSKYDGNTLISAISNGDHSQLSPGTTTLKPAVCSTLMISATQQNYYKGGNKRAVLEERRERATESKWILMRLKASDR